MSFSLGRLTAVTRGGATIDYAYDRFGRMKEDGYLTYAYDENDNRTEIGYFGVMTAVYGYDFADRAASLTLEGSLAQPVVSSAEYKPFGPLTSLALGNGLVEQRRFDGRYSPTRIEVPGLLDAVYVTDGVGNVLSIDRDGLVASFDYQAVDYFLSGTSGPWPSRSWTYDRIGNRLTEDTTTYTYDVNGSGGNTPRLVQIEPAPVVGEGAADLGYDAAGNQTSWSEPRPEGGGVETVLLTYGDDRRLSRIEEAGGTASTDFLYDGRSFLREAHQTLVGSSDYVRTTASYSSEGVLRRRTRVVRSTTGGDSDAGTAPVTSTDFDTVYLLYFGNRPVAQVIRRSNELTLVFLTTDHLGSPILATDTSGAVLWRGGIAPFGELFTLVGGEAAPDADPPDPPAPPPPPPPPPPPLDDGRDAVLTSAPVGAKALNFSTADVFLRYPGQWDDPAWGGYVPGGMYYNVHRWYGYNIGRYNRPDPLKYGSGIASPIPSLSQYLYAASRPIHFVDPVGLEYTATDILNCLNAGLDDCTTAFGCIIRANKATARRFPNSTNWNDAGDAYRHCYWSCCMAKALGSAQAQAFADGHENYPQNDTCEMRMDLANNETGRGPGPMGPAADCDTHCFTTPLVTAPIGSDCCPRGPVEYTATTTPRTRPRPPGSVFGGMQVAALEFEFEDALQ